MTLFKSYSIHSNLGFPTKYLKNVLLKSTHFFGINFKEICLTNAFQKILFFKNGLDMYKLDHMSFQFKPFSLLLSIQSPSPDIFVNMWLWQRCGAH